MNDRGQAGDPLPEPSWREWVFWALGRRRRLRVTGDSMLPTLRAGDLVLVDERAYAAALPALGEIVVARHPYQRDLTIIKRMAGLTPEQACMLLSDNPRAGSDSRTFGAIPHTRIIGRVTSRIPAERDA